MPAIPVLLQWLIVAFFGADVMKKYGFNLTETDVQNGVMAASVAQSAPPTTPGATPEGSKAPSAAQTLNDAVKNPTSLLFGAALCIGGAFLFSQLRAGFHEAAEATKDVYREGQRVSSAASGADGGPKNYSRRAKT